MGKSKSTTGGCRDDAIQGQRSEQLGEIMKKITVKDLRAEAQRLISTGEMPKLEDVLKAISEVREKYKLQQTDEWVN